MEEKITSETMREVERIALLRAVDTKWMDHIDAMDQLRDGINLRAYGQKDPVQEYQIEGFDMFNEMINSVKEETIQYVFHVSERYVPQREKVAEETGTNAEAGTKKPTVRSEEKVGRNDLCPCGSGKKYKKCCGAN